MLIYRLENAEGKGPFTSRDNAYDDRAEENHFIREFAHQLGWIKVGRYEPLMMLFGGGLELDDGSDDVQVVWMPNAEHPHHNDDVPPPDDYDNHEWKIGCKDMDQLLHWFPKKAWVYLRSLGFDLLTYEVQCDHIHFGQYQVLFCTEHATLISREPL